MATFTNPNSRPIKNGDVLTVYDASGVPHKYKWQDVNTFVDTTTGDITAADLTVTGGSTLAGKLDLNNILDLDDTQDGGASNGSIIQKTLQAGEAYTGTVAGNVIKLYDADGTVDGSGEHTGQAIFLKVLSSTKTAETSLQSLHTHSSTDKKLTNGQVMYAKEVGSAWALRDTEADYVFDAYGVGGNNTVNTAEFRGSNGETIDNTTDGIWNMSGGKIDGITTVNASTYDLLTSDNILHVTYTATGAVTSLTLPTAQAVAGRHIVIKDAGGGASGNNITIDTEGAGKIDGADTLVINTDYASSSLYSDGTNWFVY